MSFIPTPLGCRRNARMERPCKNDRHWGHWRWLNTLAQSRYTRAINLWINLYGVYPRGVACDEQTGLKLNFVKYTRS